jgi:hypothetical protein
MEPKLFCQSCSMPIDDIFNRGTEASGRYSREYCKFCYQGGVFTEPGMSLEHMKHVVAHQLQLRHASSDIIQKSLDVLPTLKRWQHEKV